MIVQKALSTCGGFFRVRSSAKGRRSSFAINARSSDETEMRPLPYDHHEDKAHVLIDSGVTGKTWRADLKKSLDAGETIRKRKGLDQRIRPG